MTQLASDNFTRANSTGLGANWTNNAAENSISFDIVSNLAQPHAINLGGISVLYTGITWGNDHYSEVTFNATDNTAADVGSGVICRATISGSINYYVAVGSASGYIVGKMVANSFTSLSTGTGTTFTAGNVLRLELQGTTWRVKKNGTQFATGTDTSLSTGGPGIDYSSTATSAASCALSLWAGGDFSVAGDTLMGQICL